MNVMFFVEPALLGLNQQALLSHLRWPTALEPAIRAAGFDLVIVGTDVVCDTWEQLMSVRGHSPQTWRLSQLDVLAEYDYSFSRYLDCQMLPDPGAVVLERALSACRLAYDPVLVFHSSQNGSLRKIFDGCRVVGMEQGFLPRFGHRERMGFDPLGHQAGSVFEVARDRILNLRLAPAPLEQYVAMLRSLEAFYSTSERQQAAIAEMLHLADGHKIALLALQLPVSPTGSGPHDSTDPASILSWAQDLPDGWVGIPTYHFGFQFSEAVEAALASHPKLRLMSRANVVDMTETLLTRADGLVTFWSTTAMTALLFGKRQVSLGHGPLRTWGPLDVGMIAQSSPLTLEERASTLAFLTHRYSWPLSLISENAPMADLLNGFREQGVDWLFEGFPSDVTSARLRFSELPEPA